MQFVHCQFEAIAPDRGSELRDIEQANTDLEALAIPRQRSIDYVIQFLSPKQIFAQMG